MGVTTTLSALHCIKRPPVGERFFVFDIPYFMYSHNSYPQFMHLLFHVFMYNIDITR